MAKSNKVGGVQPQPVVPQKTLQQKEAEKVPQNRAQKVRRDQAARLAQQAGFQRLGPHKRRRFDVGDSSNVPIPLPEEESDDEAWSQERLDKAQEHLNVVSGRLEELVEGEEERHGIAGSMVNGAFLPTEESVARLEALAKRPAPTPMPLDEASASVRRHFNIDLDDTVPTGQRLLATGLVVAGEAASVRKAEGMLDEQTLADGVQKVTQKGNQAVGEAQRMSKGVNRELNLQRTFVFKR